jgi:hypothetical protein
MVSAGSPSSIPARSDPAEVLERKSKKREMLRVENIMVVDDDEIERIII